MCFFFLQCTSETSEFSELFKNLREDLEVKALDENGNPYELPAKSRSEWIRRFGKKEEKEEKKIIIRDWLADELLRLNQEATILTYSEAEKLQLKEILYIIRSRNNYNQLRNEKMEELYG